MSKALVSVWLVLVGALALLLVTLTVGPLTEPTTQGSGAVNGFYYDGVALHYPYWKFKIPYYMHFDAYYVNDPSKFPFNSVIEVTSKQYTMPAPTNVCQRVRWIIYFGGEEGIVKNPPKNDILGQGYANLCPYSPN